MMLLSVRTIVRGGKDFPGDGNLEITVLSTSVNVTTC